MTSGLVVAASAVLMFGCKSDKEGDAAKAAPSNTEKKPAGDPAAGDPAANFPLAEGERYQGGKPAATNLVTWKVEDGSIVVLGIVTTGTAADGREQGVLRAYHAGTATHDVDQTYLLDPKVDHWAELKLLPNNRVLFRHGEAGEGPRARNAVVLRWDADAKRVVLAKRWSGRSEDPEPAWLVTGEYKPSPEAESLCLQVIARMVSCEKETPFREAIFKRDSEAEKVAMQEHFDTHVAQWKNVDEAKEQCRKWASDAYVDTQFADPLKLARLAEDTKLNCTLFAAEIVDEGGLPSAVTHAK